MLADGKVVMSTAYNGRIFNAQVAENQPFEIVWDGQVLDHSQLAIVAGAPNLEAALEFLAFTARPESMAAMSGFISCSPTRHSALPLVGTHVETGVISAVGMFFFYSEIGLAQTHLGLILAHTTLGAPFVVITVTATLSGFDRNLLRASASLGAGPLTGFRRIQLPLIAPGVVSGALFAFATSFDEVVAVLFIGGLEQRTIPRQMWSDIREEISPAILAVATVLLAFALLFMATVEWIRRRGDRPA